MKIARYWARGSAAARGARGQRLEIRARGWSDASVDEARQVAERRARQVAERLAGNQAPGNQYQYGDRPLPEPILREFAGSGGPRAVVTRNVYGALVLNTQAMMFVDIDQAEEQPGGGIAAGLKRLFGGGGAPAGVPARVRILAVNRGLTVRLYRTTAGYRALVTSAEFEPATPGTEQWLREFGADPLYTRLCRMQECFRARLTPKPWRCGLRPPGAAFPFETAAEEAEFQVWAEAYQAACAGFATCRFVESYGNAPEDPAFAELVQYHDEVTRAATDWPLA